MESTLWDREETHSSWEEVGPCRVGGRLRGSCQAGEGKERRKWQTGKLASSLTMWKRNTPQELSSPVDARWVQIPLWVTDLGMPRVCHQSGGGVTGRFPADLGNAGSGAGSPVRRRPRTACPCSIYCKVLRTRLHGPAQKSLLLGSPSWPLCSLWVPIVCAGKHPVLFLSGTFHVCNM